MAGIRDLPIEERRRLVEDAGTNNWPVGIRVNRTPTAFGITAAHHHANGSLVTFMSVGEPLPIADRLVVNVDGMQEVVPGVASRILDVVESVVLKVVA